MWFNRSFHLNVKSPIQDSAAGVGELFVGVLSGTSVDAIDAAVVRFGPRVELVATHSLAYPSDLRAELLALAVPGANEIDRLGQADGSVGRFFAQAVRELLEKAGLEAGAIRAVGSHGQTIRHRPGLEVPFTLQVGDPNVIAAGTGIPVAADFRRKDMALGGQGAPLVPAFHEAIFRTKGVDRAVINIGGIANLTILPGDSALPVGGFDSGPGNTLLDAWSRRVLNEPMDRGGALAARGRIAHRLLEACLADPYFSRLPPKSTGPEYFSMAWLQRHLEVSGPLTDADVQATLLALTTRTLGAAIRQHAGLGRQEVFVCGGGAKNDVLMRSLQDHLTGCVVERTDVLGVAGDWVEAMAFAWFARQRMAAGFGNCPAVTGASRPVVLGGLWLPE